MKKIIHNAQTGTTVEVDLTAEEEAQRIIDAEAATAKKQAEAEADAQKATLKASAKAKLVSGEALTEAEADTIVI